jgi:hypothetical protein
MKLFPLSFLILSLGFSALLADARNDKKLVLVFFGSSTCGECLEIKEKLLKPMGTRRSDKLKIDFKDIENETDLKLLTAMEEGYKVRTSATQELYFPDTVLTGYDDIMKKGAALIERYLAHPEKWAYAHAYGDSSLDTVNTAVMIRDRMKTWSFIGLFAIGFVDGINPCAIATMVFLISFLGTQKRKRSDVLKIGLAFAGTVFCTYFALGLGAFRILSLMDKFYWFSLAIRIAAVGLAVWVAAAGGLQFPVRAAAFNRPHRDGLWTQMGQTLKVPAETHGAGETPFGARAVRTRRLYHDRQIAEGDVKIFRFLSRWWSRCCFRPTARGLSRSVNSPWISRRMPFCPGSFRGEMLFKSMKTWRIHARHHKIQPGSDAVFRLHHQRRPVLCRRIRQ